MKYRYLLSAFFIFLMPLGSSAEYRVFLLKISKKSTERAPAAAKVDDTGDNSDSRLVASTLDPIQYRYYYPVAPDEEVTYTETWRCRGRTDNFKELCPNPKGQIPADSSPTP